MNREQAREIFKVYGCPQFRAGNQIIRFGRCNQKDVDEIEKMTDEQLIDEWKDRVWATYIYGQIGISVLQRIDLMELEFDERPNIDIDELRKWVHQAKIDWLTNKNNPCNIGDNSLVPDNDTTS